MKRALGDRRGIANTLCNIGRALLERGDFTRAQTCYRGSLDLHREIGDKASIAECLEGLAGVVGVLGEPADGARLFGAAEALREMVGAPLSPTEHILYQRIMTTVRTRLSDEPFAEAWAEGRAMSLEQAIAAALSTTDDGRPKRRI